MTRFLALVSGLSSLFIGYLALSIALGPKADASGWWLALVFAAGAAFCAWQAWKQWNTPDVSLPKQTKHPDSQQHYPVDENAPGAWRGPSIPVEVQIDALKAAGLMMNPGRTIEELLHSWPRTEYEKDPYNLILFMYGSEVEEAPWGRNFCDRGWNFDMECLSDAGDYARALSAILRTTGQPDIITELSDNFDINAPTCEIRYLLNGRRRVVEAKVNHDWADPEALGTFLRDIEKTIEDGRSFWAADNGQSSILFFLTDLEGESINGLREDTLVRCFAP
ncbi:MAG: hypothetical protein R3C13_09045 [Hyphomonas sp.]|uniref:hypothetical protein n=1 Tax=Hyphomonas sp. TaxID=87 RepID=UPI0035273290